MSHTFAVLGISKSSYEEIKTLLKQAGYEHAIMEEISKEVIDMHGIALSIQSPELELLNNSMAWEPCTYKTSHDKNMPVIGYPLLIRVSIDGNVEYFLAKYVGNGQLRIETAAELQDDGTRIHRTSSMHAHFVTHWTYIAEPKE